MRALLAAIVVMPAVLAACAGASSTFPEPAPCPAAAPLPTQHPNSTRPSPYFSAVRVGVDRLVQEREVHRGFYPTDTFSRRAEFRTRFAEYADETVCAAEYLINLEPTEERFAAFDSDLESALQALIAHTKAGREAVKSRNVSEYRDWYKDVDGLLTAVRTASGANR